MDLEIDSSALTGLAPHCIAKSPRLAYGLNADMLFLRPPCALIKTLAELRYGWKQNIHND